MALRDLFRPRKKKEDEKAKISVDRREPIIADGWYENIAPVLTHLLEKEKDKLNGLVFYTKDLAYHSTTANRLIVRKDGRFNIESTSTEFGEAWEHAHVDDNYGKGYSPKEVVSDNYRKNISLNNAIAPHRYVQYEPHYKEELIKEIKKRTGVDLSEESKKIKHSKLEDKLAIFIGSVLFLSILFNISDITGNVVSNVAYSTSNWIGGVLFITGLVGAFVYFRIR